MEGHEQYDHPVVGAPAVKPLQAKIPMFNGRKDWDGFFEEFEQLHHKNRSGRQQTLDHLHESLQGEAPSYVYMVPKETQEDYDQLTEELSLLFGTRVPLEPAMNRLVELRQGIQTTGNYAKLVRHPVMQAFPNQPLRKQKYWAVEFF